MARRPQSGTYRARTALGRGRGRRHGIRSKGRRVMWGALGAAVLGWLLLATLIMIGRHGAPLRALWREPVLRRPVLIFESDDWGPGAATHAEALRRRCEILGRYRDAEGHHPVMTLGMVLALPDRERMRVEKKYVALSLADARYAELRSAIEEGVWCGVFVVFLLGLVLFWLSVLLVVALCVVFVCF